MLTGILIIFSSFFLSLAIRALLRKREECTMAKVLPQLIMLIGGMIGAVIFMYDNFN